MAGIERIKIVSNWDDRNTQMSEAGGKIADRIYQSKFHEIGSPLQDSEVKYTNVSKEDVKARYDFQEGIDVVLTYEDGTRATLQEKILDYSYDTATFEELKKNGNNGAWYYCTSQLYFVGYLNKNKDGLRSGIMINLADLHLRNNINKLDWKFKSVNMLNRGTTFRYINFSNIPNTAKVFTYP